jgi:hypothetical protein
LAQRSRKRGRRSKPASRVPTASAAGSRTSSPGPRSSPSGARTSSSRSSSSAEARNAAVRATLNPVEQSERPWPTAVSAVISLALVIANLVLLILHVTIKIGSGRVSASQEIPYLLVMSICAYGLWRTRYWAVLGFMVLLLVTVLLATLALVRVTNAGGAAFAVAVIAGGGFLFYKLVRVLSRIQMPRPPSH